MSRKYILLLIIALLATSLILSITANRRLSKAKKEWGRVGAEIEAHLKREQPDDQPPKKE